jgi:hypothetical protein
VCLAAALIGCSAQNSRTRDPAEPAADSQVEFAEEALPADTVVMDVLPPVTTVPRRLRTGAPPRVPYVDGSTIVLPGGRRIVLERPPMQPSGDTAGDSYGTVLRVRSGWIGVTDDSMSSRTTFHAVDGTFQGFVDGALVDASRDRRRVLMTGYAQGRDGTLLRTAIITAPGAGPVRQVLDALPDAPRTGEEPLGFLDRRGREVVVNLMAEATGRSRGVMVTGGTRTYGVPEVARAAAVSVQAQLLSGTPHRGGRAKASTVYTLDGDPILSAPGLELVSFSPDGTLAVGLPHRWSPRRLVIVSVETGTVLVHLELRGPVTWEDDRHLLVGVSRSTRATLQQGLLRLSLGGRIEWAVPLRPTDVVAGRPIYGPHPIGQRG